MISPFDTERLLIRRLKREDAAELSAISPLEVTKWMSFMESGLPIETAEALIEGQGQAGDYFHGIYFYGLPTSDGSLVGALCSADCLNDTIEIGYWLAPAAQGKGYAFEAVQGFLREISALGRSVWAETRPDNAASIRLLTRAGFVASERPGPLPGRVEFELRTGVRTGAKLPDSQQ